MSNKLHPSFLWSLLTMRCPRCRRGDLFIHSNPYKKISPKYVLDMPEHCSVCRQQFDMERGFWYGTGYVSYGLTVVVSLATFILWWILVGVGSRDNRILWWLLSNGILLVLLQPWLMRLSRAIYIYIFVKYDADYEHTEPIKFDS